MWNLRSNALRPAGYTSVDAAGLPILPGLVNYNEVASGAMDHAIRFTAECTRQSYVWPARHEAGQDDVNCPPMGARFRLNASFFAACVELQRLLSDGHHDHEDLRTDFGRQREQLVLPGTADTRWTYNDVDQLKAIPASQFVAVDESCMMVSPNSGQALQPGTSEFDARCR